MGIFDKLFGEYKVAKYLRMLESRNGTVAEKAAEKLGELGDKRAVKPLLEYAKNWHNPAAVEALGKIGGEEAVRALKHLYWIDQYHINMGPWLAYIEEALVKLEDYEFCKKMMPKWRKDLAVSKICHAANVVIRNPEWKKDKDAILELLYTTLWNPPVITIQELLKEIDPDIRRDKEVILRLIEMSRQFAIKEKRLIVEKIGLLEDLKKYDISLDEMIAAVENRIEQINRDQEYYLEYQPFGAPENYAWDEARKPLYATLNYLKTLKEKTTR